MLNSYIDTCVKACCEELRNSSHQQIKAMFQVIEQQLPDKTQEEGMQAIVSDIVAELLSQGDMEQDEEEELILNMLTSFSKHLEEIKVLYQFKIVLKGFEEEIYRIVEVPAAFTLADLGYVMLSAFQSEAAHLFEFQMKKQRFCCEIQRNLGDVDPAETEFASEYKLLDFNFRKNAKFTCCYDFGDHFEFDFTFQKEHKVDDFVSFAGILDGKGFGIWEDAHYEMELYYHDRASFDAFIKENQIDPDDYPLDIAFDLEESNENLQEDFLNIKYAYERDEEAYELMN